MNLFRAPTCRFEVACAEPNALRALCRRPGPGGTRATFDFIRVWHNGVVGLEPRVVVSVARGVSPAVVARWLRESMEPWALPWFVDGIAVDGAHTNRDTPAHHHHSAHPSAQQREVHSAGSRLRRRDNSSR